MSDKEIVDCAKKFVKGLLGKRSSKDQCFVVCLPLSGYLQMCGCETTLTEGSVKVKNKNRHHWWLELEDGRIIDPTADQFGLDNVWLGKKPKTYKVGRRMIEIGR